MQNKIITIKPILEYSDSEILNLTEEDISRIKYQTAIRAGIKFLKEPVKPSIPELPFDETVYQIDLLNYSLAFKDMQEATKVLNLLKNSSSVGNITSETLNIGFKDTIVSIFTPKHSGTNTRESPIYIKEVKAMSENTFKMYKELIEPFSASIEEYNKKMEEYTNDKERYNVISYAIDDYIRNIKSKKELLNEYRNLFINVYMPAFNQDLDLAISHFKNVYSSISDADISYILDNNKYPLVKLKS